MDSIDKKKETKLDPDFKAKWVAALRSGEYQQGKLALHKDGKYCCLGVACKIVGITEYQMGSNWWITSYVDSFDSVPRLIRRSDGIGVELAKMNDNGFSFSEIANYIEANL